MSKPRARTAPLALTSNGVVLINFLPLLEADTVERLRAALPKELGNDWFVGGAVVGDEAAYLMRRVDDVSAEAASVISGRRSKPARRMKRRAKSR